MQRITRLGYQASRVGLRQPIQLNRLSIPLRHQTRRVSQQCFDVFGFVKDGTDLAKRDSAAWIFWHHRTFWKSLIIFIQFGPACFMLWAHGAFDYMFRRRTIAPLEPDWNAEFPYRPPEGYENPLFEPARKHAKYLAKKRADREAAKQ